MLITITLKKKSIGKYKNQHERGTIMKIAIADQDMSAHLWLRYWHNKTKLQQLT